LVLCIQFLLFGAPNYTIREKSSVNKIDLLKLIFNIQFANVAKCHEHIDHHTYAHPNNDCLIQELMENQNLTFLPRMRSGQLVIFRAVILLNFQLLPCTVQQLIQQ
jgi:hypothetical protein